MSRIISRIQPNLKAKNHAFPYQMQAFLTIKDLDYAAIFHEQGLGKTKIAIDLLLYWLSKRNIDTVLIVTKKQLVQNWLDEFKIHTYIRPCILNSDKVNNYYVLNSPAHVIVTNFETITTDKARIKLFLSCRNVGIIIDESTKLKNPASKLTQAFFELSNLFKIKIIMTGTPVANRPYDIWAQIYFLDKGKSLGLDFDDFKKNTDLTNKLSEDKVSRKKFENSVAEIFKKISSFSVRETKKNCAITLPQKVYQTVNAIFSPRQNDMYNKVICDLQLQVHKHDELLLDDESVALKRLIRLLQIASNPKLVDEAYNEESGKELVLSDLLEKISLRNEKCIVWSSFIENIEMFSIKYAQYHPCKVHGNMPINDRNKSIEKFKKDERCKVLFATPQAAKEGLTLTVANNVIFYDRGFNLDDYLQAQDRIHRISQKKICYIYNIVIEESVDLWIDKLLSAKQDAAFLAQGDISLSKYQNIVDYSYGDIIKDIIMAGGEII